MICSAVSAAHARFPRTLQGLFVYLWMSFKMCLGPSWAHHFLQLAIAETRREDTSKLFTNVTIIDFNYDRVLPQYLYWALQHNLAIPQDVAAECVKNLKILHPYGSLGKLEWETEKDALPFGSLERKLNEIANRIRTYTEESESPERAQIQDAIGGARVVIVVGFGYHEQNMRIVAGTSGHKNRLVFMTLHDINNNINHQAIKYAMLNALSCPHDLEPAVIQTTGEGMFRELRPALRLAVS